MTASFNFNEWLKTDQSSVMEQRDIDAIKSDLSKSRSHAESRMDNARHISILLILMLFALIPFHLTHIAVISTFAFHVIILFAFYISNRVVPTECDHCGVRFITSIGAASLASSLTILVLRFLDLDEANIALVAIIQSVLAVFMVQSIYEGIFKRLYEAQHALNRLQPVQSKLHSTMTQWRSHHPEIAHYLSLVTDSGRELTHCEYSGIHEWVAQCRIQEAHRAITTSLDTYFPKSYNSNQIAAGESSQD